MSDRQASIRGAVIGYGGAFNMGKHHAEWMKEAGMAFVAACDVSAERMAQAAAEYPDIRTFTQAEDLLACPDIDLVTIITPHNTHAPLAEQVLRSGKHCIIEKPMCLRTADADLLIALARQEGKLLTVFHNRRWDPWYATMQRLIAEGKIGDIFHIEMYMGQYHKPAAWWRSDKTISGGAFYDWGAHLIDYTLGLVPSRVRSVRGIVHKRLWFEQTNEDQVDSLLYFENGAFAHLQISAIARADKKRFRIQGTLGSVEGDHEKLVLYTDADGQNGPTPVSLTDSPLPPFYVNVANVLRDDGELIVKPEQARTIIALIEQTERSAAEGRELPFEG